MSIPGIPDFTPPPFEPRGARIMGEVVTVIQADREAAADFGRYIGRLTPRDADNIRVGDWDTTSDVQTFAKHRLAHQPQASEGLYQSRVSSWMAACFTPEIVRDGTERNHRFLEEALELVQSTGCTASEAHQLVDYVFGRPIGEPSQEVGGVKVTLAALCNAFGIDMDAEGERELTRILDPEIMDKIRRKQAAKPKHSPLPLATTPAPAEAGLTIPAGYALVPVKPTEAMLTAGDDVEIAGVSLLSPGQAAAVWASMLAAAPHREPEGVFRIGDQVEKVKGSSWRGRVVGAYSTAMTPEGYAVESEREPGSVQIYPATALRPLPAAPGIDERGGE